MGLSSCPPLTPAVAADGVEGTGAVDGAGVAQRSRELVAGVGVAPAM